MYSCKAVLPRLIKVYISTYIRYIQREKKREREKKRKKERWYEGHLNFMSKNNRAVFYAILPTLFIYSFIYLRLC